MMDMGSEIDIPVNDDGQEDELEIVLQNCENEYLHGFSNGHGVEEQQLQANEFDHKVLDRA